jgi:hypothetical protein
VERLGVVKLVPDANAEPPVGFAYQSIVVPVPSEAEMVTVPVPQLDPFVPVGAAGTAFTVAVTVVLVAETHPVVVFLA